MNHAVPKEHALCSYYHPVCVRVFWSPVLILTVQTHRRWTSRSSRRRLVCRKEHERRRQQSTTKSGLAANRGVPRVRTSLLLSVQVKCHWKTHYVPSRPAEDIPPPQAIPPPQSIGHTTGHRPYLQHRSYLHHSTSTITLPSQTGVLRAASIWASCRG